ncbi:hypothetical protein [Amycolatopsis sp. CA-128772]|uniref:hypothetical protein n=1 Tax=Amycolatopsis sp. CA-128772 TaxID=2073159 RepID=UPI000CD1FE69|nr:hypothetical protein [Amycolatopsis sp. CA-128772]
MPERFDEPADAPAGFAVKLGSPVPDAGLFADDAIAELVLQPTTRSSSAPILNQRAWLYRTVHHMVCAAGRHRRRIDDADVHKLADRLRTRAG